MKPVYATHGTLPDECIVPLTELHVLTISSECFGKFSHDYDSMSAHERLDEDAFGSILETHFGSMGQQVDHIESEIGHDNQQESHQQLARIGAAVMSSVSTASFTPNLLSAPSPNTNKDGAFSIYVDGSNHPIPIAPSNAQVLETALNHHVVVNGKTGVFTLNRPGAFMALRTLLTAFRRPRPSLLPQKIAPRLLEALWKPLPFGFPVYVKAPGFGAGLAIKFLATSIGTVLSDKYQLCYAVQKLTPFGQVYGERYGTYVYAVQAALTVRMPLAVKDIAMDQGIVNVVDESGQEYSMDWVAFRQSIAPEVVVCRRELISKYPYVVGSMMSTRLLTSPPQLKSSLLRARRGGIPQSHVNQPALTIIQGRPLNVGVKPYPTAGQQTAEGDEEGGDEGDDNSQTDGDN